MFLSGTSLLAYFQRIPNAATQQSISVEEASKRNVGTYHDMSKFIMEYIKDPRDLTSLSYCNMLLHSTLNIEMAYNIDGAKKKKHGLKHNDIQVSKELSSIQQQGSIHRFSPMNILNHSCKFWTEYDTNYLRGVVTDSTNHKDQVLGIYDSLSRYILQFVSDTKTLHNISMVNKCLCESIDVPLMAKCGLLEGGRPMKAITQVYPAQKTRSIYPCNGL